MKAYSGYYTCQLSCIMRESHACGLKTSISRIEDNFSRLTHKSGRVVLKKLHFISDLLCIISLLFVTIAKAFKCLQSVYKCSKVVGIFSDIFGNVRKSSKNHRKSSEVAQTFSVIPGMTRQKCHAFDSEKVGRYMVTNNTLLNCFCTSSELCFEILSSWYFAHLHALLKTP